MNFRLYTFGCGFVAAIVLATPAARSANIEYANNPGALNFADGGNWDGGIAPGASDIAIINGVDGISDYAYIDGGVGIQRFTLAALDGDSGGLEIRGGGVLTTTDAGLHYVGARGVGQLRILDGGTLNINGPMQVGWGSTTGNGHGTVTQDGGSYNGTSTTTSMTLGNRAADGTFTAAMGVYNLNGGMFTLGAQLIVGNTGVGEFNMNGGNAILNTYLQIGRTGSGTFTQTGGDLGVFRSHQDPAMVIAPFAGASGVYEISGGSLFVSDTNGGVSNGVVAGTGDGSGVFRIVGNAPTVTIGGNYVQLGGSTLDMHIGAGISPLSVGVDVTLDGALNVLFTETPTVGQEFTLVTYGGALAGTFATFDDLVDSPLGANTVGLSLSYGGGFADSIVVTVDSIGSPGAPGDFNGDGNVDGADFVIWQTNFPNNSGMATLATGDANGDGNVDGADFVVWQTNFPTTAGGISPVPEPASALLASIAIGGLLAASPVRRRLVGFQK